MSALNGPSPWWRSLPAEERLVLLCASFRMTPKQRELAKSVADESGLDWNRFYTCAHSHGLAPMVWRNLAAGGLSPSVPATVSALFGAATEANKRKKARRDEMLASVIDFVGALGMRVLLIKGAAMDLVIYDAPWLVASEDADIMFDKPVSAISHADYANLERLVVNETIVEWEFAVHHDVDMNGALDVDFASIWDRALPRSIAGRPVFVMCPEHMLLAACVNVARKGFNRIKGLSAIVDILGANPDINWDRWWNIAGDWGCQGIARRVLRLVDETFGLDASFPLRGRLGAIPSPLLRAARARLTKPLTHPIPLGARLTGVLLRWNALSLRQKWRETLAEFRVHHYYRRVREQLRRADPSVE